MIQHQRVGFLNGRELRDGDFVLYWMQASQREETNHALEYAVNRANDLNKPLVVLFGLTTEFPEAVARAYAFMLEGLKETAEALHDRGILMVIRQGAPWEEAVKAAEGASLVVVDRGYLRIEREWRVRAAKALDCPLVQVETGVVVPVETAYGKEAYTAAVLRPRIHRGLAEFLVPIRKTGLKKDSLGLRLESLDISDPEKVLAELAVDRSVGPAPSIRGGTSKAMALLKAFIDKKLPRYAEERNDPNADVQSGLSPYLHFGQISPLTAALAVNRTPGPGKAPFLEELIVRRELGMNYAFFNAAYDSYRGLPDWCRATLEKHKSDKREYVYTMDKLERAETHDPYWNAAQLEMTLTGKMHNYMRMYWGKKIIEWSATPEEAFEAAIRLNNKYELDGRDPNSFAGVAWCFGKHDRPWRERPVFGIVRYMNDAGLKRKFDADGYVRRIQELQISLNSRG